MKDEYDFSTGQRGALLSSEGQTRLMLYLDEALFEALRARAEAQGVGYQAIIEEALAAFLAQSAEKPLTESVLRRILREELPHMNQRPRPAP